MLHLVRMRRMCLARWECGRKGKRASVSSSGVPCAQQQGWVERAWASSSRQSSAGKRGWVWQRKRLQQHAQKQLHGLQRCL